MKQPQTIALAAVLAVAVGMIGMTGASADFVDTNNQVSEDQGTALIGHIVAIHRDADGNIVDYRQTDNVITFTGKNCAGELIFGATGNCTSSALFDDVAISLDTLAGAGEQVDETTVLAGECDGTTDICGAGINGRQAGVATYSTVGADNVDPVIQIRATFLKTDSTPATTPIESAGLFDVVTTESGNAFAVKDFGGTINLLINESLQVDWLITLAAPLT